MSALPRFIALFALMYAAFGVSSPFLPAFFQARGLGPEQLGILFASGTAIRLISGPLCGRLADLTQALRAVLAVCATLAALVALGLLRVTGFPALFMVSVMHAAALAPITTLADALALRAAVSRDAATRFEYGWVRGTGSGVFIAGTLLSGQVVGAWGLGSIVVLHAALLSAAACAALLLPKPMWDDPVGMSTPHAGRGVGELLAMPAFRRLMLVSALVLGSHAMHDAFAVIRWSAGGLTPAMASVVLRWVVMASTTDLLALALVQPLHGITFAALHLGCMRVIAAIVPQHLAATAQALYAFGATVTTALLTAASGRLYASLGARGFLVMALLCVAAAPLALRLRSVPSSPAP
jgi:MFS transporter, PPP family, 3-phenylpropionic acid transporter